MIWLLALLAFIYVFAKAMDTTDEEDARVRTSDSYGCAKAVAMLVVFLFLLGTLGFVGLIIGALIVFGLSSKNK